MVLEFNTTDIKVVTTAYMFSVNFFKFQFPCPQNKTFVVTGLNILNWV